MPCHTKKKERLKRETKQEEAEVYIKPAKQLLLYHTESFKSLSCGCCLPRALFLLASRKRLDKPVSVFCFFFVTHYLCYCCCCLAFNVLFASSYQWKIFRPPITAYLQGPNNNVVGLVNVARLKQHQHSISDVNFSYHFSPDGCN